MLQLQPHRPEHWHVIHAPISRPQAQGWAIGSKPLHLAQQSRSPWLQVKLKSLQDSSPLLTNPSGVVMFGSGLIQSELADSLESHAELSRYPSRYGSDAPTDLVGNRPPPQIGDQKTGGLSTGVWIGVGIAAVFAASVAGGLAMEGNRRGYFDDTIDCVSSTVVELWKSLCWKDQPQRAETDSRFGSVPLDFPRSRRSEDWTTSVYPTLPPPVMHPNHQ